MVSSIKNKSICILLMIISYLWPIFGVLSIYMTAKKGRIDYKIFSEIGVLLAFVVFVARYLMFVLS